MKNVAPEHFVKKHDFLICVDSDGCAVDTMDITHQLCFGPRMVDEWGLDEWRDKIQARWEEINLYSMTRGINRFLGLVMALEEINETYCKIRLCRACEGAFLVESGQRFDRGAALGSQKGVPGRA